MEQGDNIGLIPSLDLEERRKCFVEKNPVMNKFSCCGSGVSKLQRYDDSQITHGGGGGGRVPATEETRVEEKQKDFICPLSWCVHHNLARNGYIESTCCCVLSKIFRHGNKNNTLFLVMVYSALFNTVFKVLNLFLNKYVA